MKKLLIYKILLLSIFAIQGLNCMEDSHKVNSLWSALGGLADFVTDNKVAKAVGNGIKDAANAMGNKGKEFLESIKIGTESLKKEKEKLMQDLKHLDTTDPAYKENRKFIEKQIANLTKKIDEQEAIYTKGNEGLVNFFKNAGDAAINILKSQIPDQTQIKSAYASSLANAQETARASIENTKNILNFLSDPKKLAPVAGFGVATAAGIACAGYGAKVGFEELNRKLQKPKLLMQSSDLSLTQQMKNFILDIEPEEPRMGEIQLNPKLQEEIDEITESLEDCIINGEEVFNILLEGPAGTGKTMFAKALAQTLSQKEIMHDGDIVPVRFEMFSSTAFAQLPDGESIKEINKVLDYARDYEGITILFIDEIDALLRKRDSAIATVGHVDRTTTILTLIEAPSNPKFLIIGTTNFAKNLDTAAFTRFGKKVQFELPEGETLNKIFNQYMVKNVISKNIIPDNSFTEKEVELAQYCKGLPPRSIEEITKQTIRRMRRLLRNNPDATLSYDVMKQLIDAEKDSYRRNAQAVDKDSIDKLTESMPSATPTT